MASPTLDNTAALLHDREQERCRAISECDWPGLSALLRDDYSHTHSTGVVQDKATYVAFIQGKPRKTTRGELRVRLYGEAAIMTGRQFNQPDGDGPMVESEVIQVWINDGAWRLAACQSTRAK
jgi:hypothetical protein